MEENYKLNGRAISFISALWTAVEICFLQTALRSPFPRAELLSTVGSSWPQQPSHSRATIVLVLVPWAGNLNLSI